mgnify:FL=1|jgi:hypothetical protein
MKEIQITKQDIKSQMCEIKWHLQEKSTITSWEAIKHYGITRLSAIIFNLRKEGYSIISKTDIVKNKFGREIKVVTYVYEKPIRSNHPHQYSIYDYEAI